MADTSAKLCSKIVYLLLFSMLAGPTIYWAQNCEVTCDTGTGTSLWDSTLDPVSDFDFRCSGLSAPHTMCGGYGASVVEVARFSNTSLGTPHAVQYSANLYYVVYGHHNWSGSPSFDRIYLGTSPNGKTNWIHRSIIEPEQFCREGLTINCEFWGPRLAIRADGVWFLYVTGHHTLADKPKPRVFLATSTNGGQSFTFDWKWDAQRNQWKGILDDTFSTYRFGSITAGVRTTPEGAYILDGSVVYYAASNEDNNVYRFKSFDGICWRREGPTNIWGLDLYDIKYDAVKELYIQTQGPPMFISNDYEFPSWRYPAISLSVDGLNFSRVFVENYFFGRQVISAEAAPLGDRKGVIQASTPLLLYANDQEHATYELPESPDNSLFVMDWRRGSGGGCTYP